MPINYGQPSASGAQDGDVLTASDPHRGDFGSRHMVDTLTYFLNIYQGCLSEPRSIETPLLMLKPNCPNCGQEAGLQLLMGLPSEEAFERAQRGEIVIGGCDIMIPEDQDPDTYRYPDTQCGACNHRWRSDQWSYE